jgi:putative membrane protein
VLLTRMAVAVGAAAAFVLLPATAASAAPSDQDTAFLQAAHQSNLAEIAGGKIAQQKGQSQEVKDLGARFIEDHTRLDSALQDTAEALGVELPSAPNAEQRALAQRYEATDGADFDALYVSTQMDAHMKAMRLGQTEIAEGSDADAKKIAQDSAPVIASHHELLEDAGAAIGVPTGVDTGTGGLAADNGSPAMIGFGVFGVLLVGTALLLLRRRRIPAGQD